MRWILLGLLVGLIAAVRAQPALPTAPGSVVVAASTNVFRCFRQSFRIPERGLVPSYTVITESNRFNFVPPPRWTVRMDSSERMLTLLPADLRAGMTLRWLEAEASLASETNTTARFQSLLKRRHPEAELVVEQPAVSRAGRITVFETERRTGKLKITGRVAYIPFQQGCVEIVLNVPAGKADDYQVGFGQMLASFSAEPWPGASRNEPRLEPLDGKE